MIRMTAAEFAAARQTIGMTQMALAERLGVHWRTVQKWEAGERRVPGPVVVLMEMFREGRPK